MKAVFTYLFPPIVLCLVLLTAAPVWGQPLQPQTEGASASIPLAATIVYGSASKDTYAQVGYPDTPTGDQRNLYIGYDTWYGKQQTRVYIQFNLPSLPAGATINSAKVELYQYAVEASSSYGVTAYSVEECDWNELTLTWNNRPCTSSSSVGSATFSTSLNWKSVDITDLARQWYSGAKTNRGVMIRATDVNAKGGVFWAKNCSSSQCTGGQRPRLRVEYQVATPPTYYSISGRVTDGSGNPVAGVSISDDIGEMVTTDSSGNYTLSGLNAGTYTIVPGKTLLRGYSYLFSPTSYTVDIPPDAGGQNFTLNYASLSGRVTNADTGASIGGAQVKLNFTSATTPTSLTTQTDTNGNYRFDSLPIFTPVSSGSIQLHGFSLRITKQGYLDAESRVDISQVNNTKNIALTSTPQTCSVPFFSQVDSRWKNHPLRTNGVCSSSCNTIGKCGCTLTSAAMVFKYYGANLNPATLSDCMGKSACPFYWNVGASCTNNKAKYVGKYPFSWSKLEQELNQNHRPVILGMHRKSNGITHWVVVLSGKGSNPANYQVHDPALKGGDNEKLSARSGGYAFDWLALYKGDAICNSITSTESELQLTVSTEVAPLAASSVISGNIWVYSIDELTLTVELEAHSEMGEVTEMLIWSDSYSNTTWLPFNNFVSLPVSDFVYAQFRDEFGNETEVYSDTIHPAGPPDAPEETFLPLIIKEQ